MTMMQRRLRKAKTDRDNRQKKDRTEGLQTENSVLAR